MAWLLLNRPAALCSIRVFDSRTALRRHDGGKERSTVLRRSHRGALQLARADSSPSGGCAHFGFLVPGSAADVRKIGKALATNHVLEGSLRRSGDHIRVTGAARRCDYRVSPLVGSIRPPDFRHDPDTGRHLPRGSGQPADTTHTGYRAAFRSPRDRQLPRLINGICWRATISSNARSSPMRTQSASIAKILAADPGFALAYVGLAYALLNDNWLGGRSIAQIAAEAEAPARNGRQDQCEPAGDLRGPRRIASRAVSKRSRTGEFAPGRRAESQRQPGVQELGRLFLSRKGQPRDALFNYTRAAELDPLDSLSQAQRCVALQDLGQFAGAAAACARARSLEPQGYWPLTVHELAGSRAGKARRGPGSGTRKRSRPRRTYSNFTASVDMALDAGRSGSGRRSTGEGQGRGE